MKDNAKGGGGYKGSDDIFIIGPGGVGKSSVGPVLAGLIDYHMIDIDDEFCIRIENISQYIKRYGYESYLEENSKLFDAILNENTNKRCVYILSSGFLSTNIRKDITEKKQKKSFRKRLFNSDFTF